MKHQQVRLLIMVKAISLLSGGLDSSTTLAIALQENDEAKEKGYQNAYNKYNHLFSKPTGKQSSLWL